MKKLAALVLALICVMFIGTCQAQDAGNSTGAKQKEVMVDRNNDGVVDGVDIYNDSGKIIKRGYDTNNDKMVDRWESYDENTGMPVVTGSDTAFELR